MHSSSTPDRFDFKHCSLFELILNQFCKKADNDRLSPVRMFYKNMIMKKMQQSNNPSLVCTSVTCELEIAVITCYAHARLENI